MIVSALSSLVATAETTHAPGVTVVIVVGVQVVTAAALPVVSAASKGVAACTPLQTAICPEAPAALPCHAEGRLTVGFA